MSGHTRLVCSISVGRLLANDVGITPGDVQIRREMLDEVKNQADLLFSRLDQVEALTAENDISSASTQPRSTYIMPIKHRP